MVPIPLVPDLRSRNQPCGTLTFDGWVAESAALAEAETRGGADGADAETRALQELQGRVSFRRYLQGFANQGTTERRGKGAGRASRADDGRQRDPVGFVARADVRGRRRRYLAAGLCPECGAERDRPDRKLCARCRRRAAAKQRASRASRAA